MHACTESSLSDPRLGWTRFAPPENTRSTGAPVVGMARQSRAIAARHGYAAAFAFRHCRVFVSRPTTGAAKYASSSSGLAVRRHGRVFASRPALPQPRARARRA
jgi:hypothetical protein